MFLQFQPVHYVCQQMEISWWRTHSLRNGKHFEFLPFSSACCTWNISMFKAKARLRLGCHAHQTDPPWTIHSFLWIEVIQKYREQCPKSIVIFVKGLVHPIYKKYFLTYSWEASCWLLWVGEYQTPKYRNDLGLQQMIISELSVNPLDNH